MKRWPILLLGLALAIGAGIALLTVPGSDEPDSVSAGPPGSASANAPHPEFDEASRRALTEVLRESEDPE